MKAVPRNAHDNHRHHELSDFYAQYACSLLYMPSGSATCTHNEHYTRLNSIGLKFIAKRRCYTQTQCVYSRTRPHTTILIQMQSQPNFQSHYCTIKHSSRNLNECFYLKHLLFPKCKRIVSCVWGWA